MKVGDVLEHKRRAQVVEVVTVTEWEATIRDKRLNICESIDLEDLVYYYKAYKAESESIFDQDPYRTHLKVSKPWTITNNGKDD